MISVFEMYFLVLKMLFWLSAQGLYSGILVVTDLYTGHKYIENRTLFHKDSLLQWLD